MGVDRDGHTARVWFAVDPGVQARVRELRVDGAPLGWSTTPLQALVPGAAFSELRMDAARDAAVRALGARGYLFARAQAQREVSSDGRDVNVRVTLEPGPLVKVGRIFIQGLRRTDERLVRATLGVSEGQMLLPDSLFEAQRALGSLGLFRQAVVRLLSPELPELTKDVVVELRERPRLDGGVSGGYYLVDGPRVGVDSSYPNVDGRGVNLSVRGRLNYVGWGAQVLSGAFDCPEDCGELQGVNGLGGRGIVSLTQPRLFSLLPFRVGARADVIAERIHRDSYVSTRFAGVGGVDWSTTRWLTLTLQLELENARVRPLGARRLLVSLGRPEERRSRFPFGNFTLATLRPGATLDFRDDPVFPRRGILVASTAELLRDLAVAPTDVDGTPQPDFPINALKLSGSVTGYVPLGKRSAIAASARAGTLVSLERNSQVIPPKRFYLGGAGSLRGFREDGLLAEERRTQLRRSRDECEYLVNPAGCASEAVTLQQGDALLSEGGELFTLGKLELRTPAFASLDLGLFLEAGNLWLNPGAYRFEVLRYVAGAGIRYATPVGPLALDVGFNLSPDERLNEAPAQVHFSIGLF